MISISFKFPNLLKRLTGRLGEVDLFVAAQLQTNRGMLFDSEGTRNGGPGWKKPMLRVGQAGGSSGKLRQSIAPPSGDGHAGPGGFVRLRRGMVSIGTNLIYARTFNFGGIIRAKNGKALRIPLPAGKRATETAKAMPARREQKTAGKGTERVMYRKWVKIPARRFDILTAADDREISQALENKLAQLLGAKSK